MAVPTLLALLLAAAPLPAEEPSAPCALRAQVVDERGEPVAGARLGAFSLTGETDPDARSWVRTDERGRAQLPLRPDVYRWSIASDTHPTLPLRTVVLDGTCEGGDLGRVRLSAGAAIAGRVTDPAGDPLADATVSIGWDPHTPYQLTVRHDGVIDPYRAVTTDRDGIFRIEGVSPETEYTLDARRPRYRPARQTATPGDEPVVLRLDPAARLVVKVVDPDGEGVAGAEIGLQALGEGESFGGLQVSNLTDSRGRFEAESLEPGATRIEVRAPGYEHARRSVDLAAGALRRERFEVAPVPSGAVTVDLVDDDGEPVSRAYAHLASAPRTSDGTYLSGQSDERGRVSWPRVPHGRYEVSVQVPDGVLADRPEALPLEVGPGGAHATLVLHRPDGRPQEGRLVYPDGAGVAGASVLVLVGTKLEVVSGVDGRFRFERLPYGQHKLYLHVPGIAGVPPRKAMVADEAAPWVFEIPHGVEVSGRLVVPPGVEPDGEWRISGTSTEGEHAGGWLEGDSRYRLPPLAPGHWTLEARDDRTGGQVEIDLTAGDAEVHRDIAIEAPVTFPVTGTLLHRGRPLAEARVGLSTQGLSLRSFGDTTGADGRFEMPNVTAGTYYFGISWGGAPVLHRTVELDGPIDLGRELGFGWLRGRVEVDGVDPTTLQIRLHPLGPGGDGAWYYSTHSYPEWAVPRSDGTFEVGPLEEGRWRIELSAPGHADAGQEIVVAGNDVENVVLAPEPTQGLSFRLVSASGRLPDHVSVTYRLGEGGEIRSFFEDLEPVVHLESAPPGRGTLELDTGYGRVGPVAVEVPGPVVEIELAPRGKVALRAPLLDDEEAARAVVSIRQVAEEQPAHTHALGRSGRAFEVVPPGVYEVRVDAEDGRSWSRLVEVRDQETTEVELR